MLWAVTIIQVIDNRILHLLWNSKLTLLREYWKIRWLDSCITQIQIPNYIYTTINYRDRLDVNKTKKYSDACIWHIIWKIRFDLTTLTFLPNFSTFTLLICVNSYLVKIFTLQTKPKQLRFVNSTRARVCVCVVQLCKRKPCDHFEQIRPTRKPYGHHTHLDPIILRHV